MYGVRDENRKETTLVRQILPAPPYPLLAPPYNFFIPQLPFMKLHKYPHYFLKL